MASSRAGGPPGEGGGIYLTTTMSLYICLSSFFVTWRLYGGGSSSYVSKDSSLSLTLKGSSSFYRKTQQVSGPSGHPGGRDAKGRSPQGNWWRPGQNSPWERGAPARNRRRWSSPSSWPRRRAARGRGAPAPPSSSKPGKTSRSTANCSSDASSSCGRIGRWRGGVWWLRLMVCGM